VEGGVWRVETWRGKVEGGRWRVEGGGGSGRRSWRVEGGWWRVVETAQGGGWKVEGGEWSVEDGAVQSVTNRRLRSLTKKKNGG
jgi:hypothetical protein